MDSLHVQNGDLIIVPGKPGHTRMRLLMCAIRAYWAICASVVLYILFKPAAIYGQSVIETDVLVVVLAGCGASLAAYAALRQAHSLRVRAGNEDERVRGDGTHIKGEKNLEGSEKKYWHIFNNSVQGIFQRTLEGAFLTINNAYAHMHGYKTPGEMMILVDADRQLYVNRNDAQTFRRLMLRDGSVENFEALRYRRDASTFWSSVNARVVRDEKGDILFFEGTVEEITKRKKEEEELRHTLQRVRQEMEATIHLVEQVVEMRDPYTAGHQKRVTSLARAIGQEMGLSDDSVAAICMAGRIHDLGKISIPAELLSKPGKLSAHELQLVRDHCRIGFDMVRDVELPYPVATIILEHHEKFDGSGYPGKLKAEQILLEARIIAVADVVEAMVSHRPYRAALGLEKALDEISSNKGRSYDPDVVDACLRLFQKKAFKFK